MCSEVPGITAHSVNGQTIKATFQENVARVVRAEIIYTTPMIEPQGRDGEEWFRMIGEMNQNQIKATMPAEATHAYINLIDENNFSRDPSESGCAKLK